MERIRLVIVDDVAAVRQGLRTLLPLLAQAADIELVIAGEAANGREAVEMAETLPADVILMDLAMPEMDGLAAAAAIKRDHPEIRVVAFSVHSSAETRRRALAAGMAAFVEKGAAPSTVLEAICGATPGTPTPPRLGSTQAADAPFGAD